MINFSLVRLGYQFYFGLLNENFPSILQRSVNFIDELYTFWYRGHLLFTDWTVVGGETIHCIIHE